MIFLRADGIGILLGWGSIQLWRVSRGRERADNILRSISITVSFQENNVLRD
jgi:hypothetical protein